MEYLRASWALVLWGGLLAPAVLAESPIVADGDLLASAGCAACHGDLAPAGLRAAPDLRLAAPRLRPEYLAAFLAAPHEAQPDTRMPDLLRGTEPAERARTAAALVDFLRSVAAPRQGEPFPAAALDGASDRGERLFHEVGCVLCHGPRALSTNGDHVPAPPSGARSLDHVADKYTTAGLAAFLFEPLAHRPAGLMPDMHLTRDEAADLAAYLAPGGAAGSGPGRRPSRVAEGLEHFRELACGRCHAGVDDAPPRPVPAARVNPAEGCLAPTPPATAPDYHFDDAERVAFQRAMAALDVVRSPDEILADSLGAFRCTACHERGGAGGVPATLDDYLVTTELDLGDHARRPPRLDGAGGKLRREWLERVVFDGASVRPYMLTRMPVFGEANVAHLPGLLESIDAEPELTFPKLEGDAQREARDAAREMLGTKSLGCVTCHVFNTKPAPTFQGLDLINSPERLRERWFHDFLIAPQARLPGVLMPDSWPGGVAVHDTLLGGDTERQIAALWNFLTLGRTAPDPFGISQPRWNVDVGERPRVYRGRSRVAGFRGVAVGFPEGMHYAFDAQNGALAAIWRGDFVSVNWNGQGAGDFNPRARAVELSRDVSMVKRRDSRSEWPTRPLTTKEEPVNPDPTYPRDLGYRFRGYHVDSAGVPVLRYALRDLSVEDYCVPATRGDRTVLKRTVTLDAPTAADIAFRVLTGPIEDLGDRRFRAGRLVVSIPDVPTRIRPLGEQTELILDVDLLEGRTKLELIYDLVE